MSGPYRTESEALAEPMPTRVTNLHRAGLVRSGDPDRRVHNTVTQALFDACASAGVELGDYDKRILGWLANWETSAAQVVLDMVVRAHSAGKAAGDQRAAEMTEAIERLLAEWVDPDVSWDSLADPVRALRRVVRPADGGVR